MTPTIGILCPAVLALCLALTEPAQAQARTVPSADFNATCHHFENRARFRDRGQDSDLVVWLADSCRSALADLTGEEPAKAQLGRRYLSRLAEFKSLTLAMMLDMRRAHGGHRIGDRSQRIRRIGLTPAGEYLIARHMGLILAYDDWAAAAGFRLTARD